MRRQPHIYEPLESGHLRLLTLTPRKKHAHHSLSQGIRAFVIQEEEAIETSFQCRIEHVPVGRKEYYALSYTWGKPKKKFWIHVENEQSDSLGWIGLTSNLNDALLDLSQAEEVHPKTFWIDQICINQEDFDERSEQVRLMHNVYSNAYQVITYLGREQPGDAVLWNYMKMAFTHFEPHLYSEELYFGLGLEYYRHHSIPHHLKIPHTLDPSATKELQTLLGGEWITRRWCIPENMVNPKTNVLRGRRTLSLDWVLQYIDLQYIGIVGEIVAMSPAKWTTASMLGLFRIRLATTSSETAAEHFTCSSSFSVTHCSEPKDRIYAMIGCASDNVRLNIVPDYGKSDEEVFIDFMIKNMEEYQVIRILDRCRGFREDISRPWLPLATVKFWRMFSHYRRKPSSLSLPSWVPDFAGGEDVIPNTYSGGETKSRFEILRDPLVLKVEGLFCTRISKHYKPFQLDLYRTNRRELKRWRFMLKDILQLTGATVKSKEAIFSCMFEETPPVGVGDGEAASAFDAFMELLEQNYNLDIRPRDWKFKLSSTTDDRLVKLLLRLTPSRHATYSVTKDRRLCKTYGLVKSGDKIVNFLGGATLYILREVQDSHRYVGQGYIHGLMHGEMFQESGWEEKVEIFDII